MGCTLRLSISVFPGTDGNLFVALEECLDFRGRGGKVGGGRRMVSAREYPENGSGFEGSGRYSVQDVITW